MTEAGNGRIAPQIGTAASGFANAEAYAAKRRRELLAALSLAGVPASRVVRLGVADQEAALQLVPLVARLNALLT